MIDVGQEFERLSDYVGGRLPPEEQRAFEDRLAREPELVRELEMTLRLREGLEQLRARGELVPRTSPSGVPRLAWVAGLAAAIVGAIAVMLWTRTNSGPPPLLTASVATAAATGARAPVAAHFTFMALRSAASPVLELPADGVVELRAMPTSLALGARYRVLLDRVDHAGGRMTVGTVSGLDLGGGGFVYSYAAARLLQPGDYELRVETEGATPVAVGTFPFTLRPGGR